MPKPPNSSLKAPRNSRIKSSRSAFHSTIPLSGVRSSLFPLVSHSQSQPATPRSLAHALAPTTLSQSEPHLRGFPGSRVSLLVQLRAALWPLGRTASTVHFCTLRQCFLLLS